MYSDNITYCDNSHKIDINPIKLMIVLMILCILCNQWLNVSGIIYFSIDICIICYLIISKNKIVRSIRNYHASYIFISVFFMFSCAIIGCIGNNSSLALSFYGIYRFFRFFLFFLCCIIYLSIDKVKKLMSMFNKIFVINAVVTFFQYFALGIKQDNLGGIFGVNSGVNQYTNLLFILITTVIVPAWFFKKISLKKFLGYLLIMLIISALAEIKVYYFEFLIICIVTFLVSKISIKNFAKILLMAILFILGMKLLIFVFPYFTFIYDKMFSVNGIISLFNMQTHYSTDTDLGRISAIPTIRTMFFYNSTFQKLFGLGIGSCSASSYFTSNFYNIYSNLHYDEFFYSFVYLEQGMVGIILYVFFLLSIIFYSLYKYRKNKKSMYYIVTINAAITTVILMVYNSSLISQFGFIIYFLLSFPFVLEKEQFIK